MKIFITMLAKKDSDHIVRGTAYNIAQWAKKPKEEDRVLQALKRLQEPDTKRLEPQPFEGRRIEKIEGIGYLVLNGQYYENLMRQANRRAYKAEKQREYRKKNKPLPGETSAVKAMDNGDQTTFDKITEGSIPEPPVERDNETPF